MLPRGTICPSFVPNASRETSVNPYRISVTHPPRPYRINEHRDKIMKLSELLSRDITNSEGGNPLFGTNMYGISLLVYVHMKLR